MRRSRAGKIWIPNYVSDIKHWNDPTKAASREDAIIKTYHKFFGLSVPKGHQYWTMCSHQEGELSELNHLCSSGLIDRTQFRGVDIEPSIIDRNRFIHPDVWWRLGHFVDVMEDEIRCRQFKPSIINYDGVQQTRGGCDFLKSIMLQVDCHVQGGLLLVANFLLNNPYCRSREHAEAIDVVTRLAEVYDFPDHWRLEPEYYWYPGTGNRTNSQMGILMFVKDAHKKLSFSRNRRIA